MVHLKVCCIASPLELRQAIAAGASAVGLVGPMPSGPGVIPLAAVKELGDTGRVCDWTITSVGRG